MGLSGPVPARVPAEVKELVLSTVDDAVAGGYSHRWATGLWQVSDDRVHRWRARRRDGDLEDRAPGAAAPHRLLDGEVAAILEIAEQWGPVDRSHRKLAHRGSYQCLVWVSPSTFRRVLAAHGLVLAQQPAPPRRVRTPWPPWLVWEPNRIWIWDVTHFGAARRVVFAIVDMVSRRWIATLVSTEETSTQVRVVFDAALVAEGLDELLTDERLDLDTDDPDRPILLAVSDNGPAMTSTATRAYMTLMAIAQHHGRPHTPTHQAWIESFFGHIKHEWPHLNNDQRRRTARHRAGPHPRRVQHRPPPRSNRLRYPQRRTPPPRRTHPRGPPPRPETSPPTTARPQPPDNNNHTREHPTTRLITNPNLRGRLRHTSPSGGPPLAPTRRRLGGPPARTPWNYSSRRPLPPPMTAPPITAAAMDRSS